VKKIDMDSTNKKIVFASQIVVSVLALLILFAALIVASIVRAND
jgi:membrane protein involved in colicin uptake